MCIRDRVSTQSTWGQVYGIKHTRTGEIFAAKFLNRANFQQSQEFRWRLRSEINILRTLDHPNIVKFHSAYDAKHFLVIVTELAEGVSLHQFKRQLGDGEAKTVELFSEVLKQTASALAHCHEMNIVHRDLKPDNLMVSVTDSGLSIKLVDFGLAGNVNELQGCLLYTSPSPRDQA
eukprot:TRINITY_DN27636_c0_g1_i1.p1 TRINITY_DN27636_c0_g1~~TRINITY_DN27636_c0_g1_i1.p1  ORF type:complete len:176 (-),score=47.93 TRINITY_DN27636_c0_g1_i1:133-660(-)